MSTSLLTVFVYSVYPVLTRCRDRLLYTHTGFIFMSILPLMARPCVQTPSFYPYLSAFYSPVTAVTNACLLRPQPIVLCVPYLGTNVLVWLSCCTTRVTREIASSPDTKLVHFKACVLAPPSFFGTPSPCMHRYTVIKAVAMAKEKEQTCFFENRAAPALLEVFTLNRRVGALSFTIRTCEVHVLNYFPILVPACCLRRPSKMENE